MKKRVLLAVIIFGTLFASTACHRKACPAYPQQKKVSRYNS